ncbi:mucin-21-like [Procambarus clarkii]|uniref:mucin-21-like n=1 Tax=Procambarus clarkii TaxID=6728 RepID=UPI003742B0B2
MTLTTTITPLIRIKPIIAITPIITITPISKTPINMHHHSLTHTNVATEERRLSTILIPACCLKARRLRAGFTLFFPVIDVRILNVRQHKRVHTAASTASTTTIRTTNIPTSVFTATSTSVSTTTVPPQPSKPPPLVSPTTPVSEPLLPDDTISIQRLRGPLSPADGAPDDGSPGSLPARCVENSSLRIHSKRTTVKEKTEEEMIEEKNGMKVKYGMKIVGKEYMKKKQSREMREERKKKRETAADAAETDGKENEDKRVFLSHFTATKALVITSSSPLSLAASGAVTGCNFTCYPGMSMIICTELLIPAATSGPDNEAARRATRLTAQSSTAAESSTAGTAAQSSTAGTAAKSSTAGTAAQSSTAGTAAQSSTAGTAAQSSTAGTAAQSSTAGTAAQSSTAGTAAQSSTAGTADATNDHPLHPTFTVIFNRLLTKQLTSVD